MKAATVVDAAQGLHFVFQSTPPVKAATCNNGGGLVPATISIHAAREGGDPPAGSSLPDRLTISIHAAREGGDNQQRQSRNNKQISIHAAREGGDMPDIIILLHTCISIHAAREGGDSADSKLP